MKNLNKSFLIRIGIVANLAAALLFFQNCAEPVDLNKAMSNISSQSGPTSKMLEDKIVVQGQAVTMQVVVTPPEGLTYEWKRENSLLAEKTNTLILFNVSESDEGLYSVVVRRNGQVVANSSGYMRVDQSAVVGAPAVVTNPSAVTVNAGQGFTLTASFSGAGLSYSWYRNGFMVIGANQSSFSVASASSTDAGEYVAMATNTLGSTATTPIQVTVSGGGSATGSGTKCVKGSMTVYESQPLTICDRKTSCLTYDVGGGSASGKYTTYTCMSNGTLTATQLNTSCTFYSTTCRAREGR